MADGVFEITVNPEAVGIDQRQGGLVGDRLTPYPQIEVGHVAVDGRGDPGEFQVELSLPGVSPRLPLILALFSPAPRDWPVFAPDRPLPGSARPASG